MANAETTVIMHRQPRSFLVLSSYMVTSFEIPSV